MADSNYKIRLAASRDLMFLGTIEQAAAELFRETAYAWIADAEPPPLSFYQLALAEQRIWTAVNQQDDPVGFAIVQIVDRTAYLQEIDVHPKYGRRGIGTSLVQAICIWAKQQGYEKVTLSTFVDVPWNAPFYQKLGFQVWHESDLTTGFQTIRQKEIAEGFAIAQRVIMYCDLINYS